MPRQREITGVYLREIKAWPNGDSRAAVAVIETDDGKVTVKGEIAEGELKSNLTYRFYGHFRTHHVHGEQFQFTSFIAEEPATREGIIGYLSQLSGKELGIEKGGGIGPGSAGSLWEEYGADAVKVLRETPDRVIFDGAAPRLKPDVVFAASAWIKADYSVWRAKVDLIGLLNGRGFPKKTVDRAIQKWGSAAAHIIRRDPHYLMKFRGCGFLGSDKMYCDLGKNPGRLKRQALCAWYAVSRQCRQDGHTWLMLSQAHAAIRSAVAGADPMPEKATELAIRAGMLTVREDRGTIWIAEASKDRDEEKLAQYIDDARREGLEHGSPWPDVSQIEGIDDHQREQLTKALSGPIGILAGSPGTGKTFTAAALMRFIQNQQGSNGIAGFGPTGKSAVRFTELMNENGVTIQAVTTHRLLVVQSGEDGWSFKHNETCPLPYRLIVGDEESMQDCPIMRSVLAARAPMTGVLLIGDVNQLAPVGHGAPLRDMIAAGVPYGELTEIRRNSGRIVRACAEIRDHQRFSVAKTFHLDAGENLMCLQKWGAVDQTNALTSFLTRIRALGDDPIWDCQVIVPMNKKSPISRKPLNKLLQGLLNPEGEAVSGNPFRVGDKAINLKNGWFPSLDTSSPEANKDGKVFVANGEMAEVLTVEQARTIVRLKSPDRTIIIPHGSKADDVGEEDDGKGDGDDTTSEESGVAGSWDLGFVCTCHKFQGSEVPWAIVMLDEAARRLMTRNWLYTAISRAKKGCLLIGPKNLADEACKKDGLTRKTLLVERLRELKEASEPKVEVEPLSDEELDEIFGQAKEMCAI